MKIINTTKNILKKEVTPGKKNSANTKKNGERNKKTNVLIKKF